MQRDPAVGARLADGAPAKVSYLSLPHKTHLLVLMLARFTDSLAISSIHAYMFYQLKHFDPNASNATISTQSGLLIGCKTAAHVCTGLIWGRFADHVLGSRKMVLVIGLLSSNVAIVGYGFSTTFYQAIAWQTVDGALNATVAMVRCMTAELNPEKKYRVRALTLLPLFANVGSVLGPLLGGFLAATDSKRSLIASYPFAMPNVCIAGIQTMVALAAIFHLTDTFRYRCPDLRKNSEPQAASRSPESPNTATTLPSEEINETTALLSDPPISSNRIEPEETPDQSSSMPFREIWTSNVITTMIAQFIIAGHLGTFGTLWSVFLSLPVGSSRNQHLPFQFSGGLGMRPHLVGTAMSSFAFAGIILQIVIYPTLQDRWGAIRVWRAALCVFPIVYFAAPFCALVPAFENKDTQTTRLATNSFVEWLAVLSVLFLFAAGRTGVVPATTLLINDCTPHAGVRGTIHATGVICSNLSRSIFPPLALAVMGYGLRISIVGLGFWFMAALAVLSFVASLKVQEGRNGES